MRWHKKGKIYSFQTRAGLSIGLRGAIAQGHKKIGGTTLVDCRMDILVAYIIFLKGTYIYGPIILINLTSQGFPL